MVAPGMVLLQVADFNLSKLMEESSVVSSAAVMNPRWLAPEVLGGAPATFASVSIAGRLCYRPMYWSLGYAPQQ